jgi:hypothetical protein
MYRLRVVPLFLPPLRARPEDVAILVDRFLSRLADDERTIEHVSAGALRLLETYEWPGNVRELQNVVEHAFVMGDGPVLLESDLPPELRGEESHATRANVPPPMNAKTPEEQRIRRALERAGGHRGRAAAMLGMSRSTLWRKMRSYGLDEGAEQEHEDDAESVPRLRGFTSCGPSRLDGASQPRISAAHLSRASRSRISIEIRSHPALAHSLARGTAPVSFVMMRSATRKKRDRSSRRFIQPVVTQYAPSCGAV